MRQIDIPLDKLIVSTLNSRKDLYAGQEDSGIEELAASIRQQGLLSPPIVHARQQTGASKCSSDSGGHSHAERSILIRFPA